MGGILWMGEVLWEELVIAGRLERHSGKKIFAEVLYCSGSACTLRPVFRMGMN
jgi:hypothetical protein